MTVSLREGKPMDPHPDVYAEFWNTPPHARSQRVVIPDTCGEYVAKGGEADFSNTAWAVGFVGCSCALLAVVINQIPLPRTLKIGIVGVWAVALSLFLKRLASPEHEEESQHPYGEPIR